MNASGDEFLTVADIARILKELVTVLRGRHDAPQLKHLVELWESWWAHRDAIDWSPDRMPAVREILDAGLLREIEVAVAKDPEVLTLGDRRPNWVREVTPDGVWVETERSRVAGRPPQLVEAWMIQSAWDYLQPAVSSPTGSCSAPTASTSSARASSSHCWHNCRR